MDKDKERYIVDVYDCREDTQYDGVPRGMQFFFDDFNEATNFIGDMILKHHKYVMFGIVTGTEK